MPKLWASSLCLLSEEREAAGQTLTAESLEVQKQSFGNLRFAGRGQDEFLPRHTSLHFVLKPDLRKVRRGEENYARNEEGEELKTRKNVKVKWKFRQNRENRYIKTGRIMLFLVSLTKTESKMMTAFC